MRLGGESDYRLEYLALRHQRERESWFPPALRKFRIIAVRGDGPVLLIGLP